MTEPKLLNQAVTWINAPSVASYCIQTRVWLFNCYM